VPQTPHHLLASTPWNTAIRRKTPGLLEERTRIRCAQVDRATGYPAGASARFRLCQPTQGPGAGLAAWILPVRRPWTAKAGHGWVFAFFAISVIALAGCVPEESQSTSAADKNINPGRGGSAKLVCARDWIALYPTGPGPKRVDKQRVFWLACQGAATVEGKQLGCPKPLGTGSPIVPRPADVDLPIAATRPLPGIVDRGATGFEAPGQEPGTVTK